MKRKWLKLGIEYSRKNETGTTSALFRCGPINRQEVEKVIGDYVKSWAGNGSLTILVIETGPFGADTLSPEDTKHFLGQIHTFRTN